MSDVKPLLLWNRGGNLHLASPKSWPENFTVAAGLLVFFLAWTFHAAIAGADKSSHYDVLEAYAWGKEFQLGYHQHGPFWAWIAGGWFLLFPKTDTSFRMLEGLNATIGLLGAWQLIGLFVSGRARLTATLLLVATPFYTFLAYKFNANTIFISLWPWTLYLFVKSVDRMKMRDALLFGLLAAASILSKYYAVTILLTCAFSLAFHPNGRRYVLSALPWAAAAVFIACVLPHFIWSFESGSPPVAYAMSLTGKSLLAVAGWSVRTLIDAAAYHVLVAAIIFMAWRGALSGGAASEEHLVLPIARRKFLAVLALLPLLLTVAFGLAFRLKTSAVMALGTFPLMPLFLMQLAAPLNAGRCFRLSSAVALAITLGAAAAAPIEREIVGRIGNDKGMIDPQHELASRVTELWHAETGAPLRHAGGTIRYANGISFYSKDRPSAFAGLDFSRAAWLTPAKLKQEGLLIACADTDTECLGGVNQFLSGKWKQFSMNLSRRIGSRQTPDTGFQIFIVPPQAEQEPAAPPR
jgi:hypothetical protein